MEKWKYWYKALWDIFKILKPTVRIANFSFVIEAVHIYNGQEIFQK